MITYSFQSLQSRFACPVETFGGPSHMCTYQSLWIKIKVLKVLLEINQYAIWYWNLFYCDFSVLVSGLLSEVFGIFFKNKDIRFFPYLILTEYEIPGKKIQRVFCLPRGLNCQDTKNGSENRWKIRVSELQAEYECLNMFWGLFYCVTKR